MMFGQPALIVGWAGRTKRAEPSYRTRSILPESDAENQRFGQTKGKPSWKKWKYFKIFV